jgi:hypothetical protein
LRKEASNQLQVLIDGVRVGKQAIQRYDGSRCWKQCEQGIERHSCRNEKHTIVLDAVIDAPCDVFPALDRDVRGFVGRTSATAIGERVLQS